MGTVCISGIKGAEGITLRNGHFEFLSVFNRGEQ